MLLWTRNMQKLFEKIPIVTLGTSAPDGTPNAVPVGAKRLVDPETIIISDQYFNKTLANMKSNPKVTVLFWELGEGYQLKGHVEIQATGKIYEETAEWVHEQTNGEHKSKGAVILKIEEIYSVAGGVTIGVWASKLFIPFFQAADKNVLRPPSMIPLIAWQDIGQIAGAFTIVLVLAQVVVISAAIRRGVFQALRIGDQE